MTTPGGHSTDRSRQLIDMLNLVDELTKPIHHEATYDLYNRRAHRMEQRKHSTRQPSLLEQLRRALPLVGDGEAASLGGSYESRPPLNSDALDCLLRIEAWSARWVAVALKLKLRTTVEDNLRALVGEAGALEPAQLASLVSDIRSWHTWARTVTDWQAPAWQPHAPCPVCEKRKGLRVRLGAHTAVCVLCGAWWTAETIGVLADHVRVVGEDGKGLRVAV